MDEGRKRVLLIAAAILASLHMRLIQRAGLDGVTGSVFNRTSRDPSQL